MQEALAKNINILKTNKFASATLVLGNISCDLDSAVCPIVYALFLQWQHSQNEAAKEQSIHNAEDREKVYVPILNVNREDYELKTEVTCWFNENDLNKNDLLFRDDVDLRQLIKSTNTNVILLDHHIPAETDRFLLHRVVEIIDHRPRDAKNWTYGENVLVNIQLVGSCSSLVCERVRSGGEFFKYFPACCNLLYGTIILDTVNFSQQVKKGTPLDMEQVLHLEAVLGVQDPVRHREATLSRLASARRDVSMLSPAQLLRKDAKVSGKILVPSFPILVKEVISREGAAAALREQSLRSRCTAVVLLGMRLGDSVERDLAVWSECEWGVACELADKLVRCSEPPLQLEQHSTELSNCRYYRQRNLAASRKQVMPVVDSFVAGREGRHSVLQS